MGPAGRDSALLQQIQGFRWVGCQCANDCKADLHGDLDQTAKSRIRGSELGAGVNQKSMWTALENPEPGSRLFAASDLLATLLVRAAVCALLLLGMRGAPAQTVTVVGSQTTLPGTYPSPTGVAVDASGRVFVADANELDVVYPPLNSAGKYPTGVSGTPFNVAVDSAGNIYVSYSNIPGKVYFMSHGASPAAFLCGTSVLGSPARLATGINEPGNVWASIGTTIAACNQSSGEHILYTGSAYIQSMAVDPFEDFYFVDSIGALYEATPKAINTLNQFGSGSTISLAVDGGGNLYLANDFSVAQAQGAFSWIGYNGVSGIAVDALGNLYVADNGNNVVDEIQTLSLLFPPIVTCNSSFHTPSKPCSETMQFTVTFSAPAPSNPPRLLTQGALNQDFTLTNSSCTSTASGGACTDTTGFSPKFAGMRRGALQILNSSNLVLLQVPLYGIGFGEQPSFGSSAATVVLPAG